MRTAWWLLRERSSLEREPAKPCTPSERVDAHPEQAPSSCEPRAAAAATGDAPASGPDPAARED
jgi:hypothetical protein